MTFSRDMHVSGDATQRPPTPGYQFRGNQRKRERRSPVPPVFRIMTSPRLRAFSIDMSDCDPLFRSSCCGISCTVHASLICPRRASDLLGAERCDPQPSRALRCHVADAPRRVDGAVSLMTQTSHLVRPSKNVENTPKIELFTMSFSAS